MVPNDRLSVNTGVSMFMKMMNCRSWRCFGLIMAMRWCSVNVGYYQHAKRASFNIKLVDTIL